MRNRFLIGITLLLLCQNSYAWFDCNWFYRSEVAVTETSGATLTDYQILVNLDASSFHPDYDWSSQGDDLRFVDSDDLSVLDIYIRRWNAASKTATVWVKVSNLTASTTTTIYMYYENSAAPPVSSPTATMTETGIKLHTRNTGANPNSKTSAFNFFNAANDNVAGYGCKSITALAGVNNRNQFTPARGNNFMMYSETFFEVKPSEVGTWSFRYGGDFGRGAAMYVDGIAIEEDWNTNVWWANDWGNVDVLIGSINLSAGYHRLEVLGAEGCCDGGNTAQFQKPGSGFQTFDIVNIDMVTRKCASREPTSVFNTKSDFPPQLTIKKTSEVISDPINNTTFPKRIAGARVRYTITVSNAGSAVDADSIKISDPIDNLTDLLLANTDISFQDGPQSSGLNFVYAGAASTTDNIQFSNNGGTSYVYNPTPSGNIDSNINAFQITPTGSFACSNSGQPSSFDFNYDVLIK